MKLNDRSTRCLYGVHGDLVRVVTRAAAITSLDFVVTEGVRTLARQTELLAAHATQTLKSRHLTGHAVDLATVLAGEVRWDWPLYHRLAEIVKQAAKDASVTIEWGGDWTSFKDGPHYQLPWAEYPA